ncbi:MAG: FAD-dependent oxidoreductase, partial [Syntrophomonadaceae bacterium]|nr:FAD-dependent oxidoreductase [Syntrophomonadaceae bacterium]
MTRKVLIVGGVAGGASAAARLRRLDESAEIIIFERGEHISFANCGLPYYVGGVIPDRNSLLVQTPQAMKKRFNIDVRTFSEVVHIIPTEKKVEVRNLLEGITYEESYDYLVLSPGATPFRPPVQGIDLPNVFTVRNIPDSDLIKNWVKDERASTAVVVGGGFVGLEMAENLIHAGLKVALVEAGDQVMMPLDREMANIVHRYLRRRGIDLYLSERMVKCEGESQVKEVKLASGTVLPADLVILGTGVLPEVELARDAGLTVGPTRGIAVNEHLQTSDVSIYAVGDAIQVKNFVSGMETMIPLAGPANKQGRIVADNICGRSSKYEGTLGTAIAKIFDMVVATTGLNEKVLQKTGQRYEVSYTHPEPYATYYPGGNFMSIKLIFDPENSMILGAQIVGYEGVDKRIDVLAACIRKGLNVFDLQELELAYAPPFSSAKDPVNMAGYVAGNIVNGDMEIVHWHQIEELKAQEAIIIDVRSGPEYWEGAI